MDVKNTLFNICTLISTTQLVKLSALCADEPCYGTSAIAIELTNDDQPKYIRITDFDDYGIKDNHVYMTASTYSSKHFLKKGDILFARTGGTVGKTYYYDGSIGKAVFAGYCIRFRFDQKKVIPKFVYWNTKTKRYANWVNGIQRPSGQPNINKEEYKSFEIVLPDLEKQKEFICLLDNAEKCRNKKTQQADDLFSRVDSILLSTLGLKFPEFNSKLTSAVHLSDVKADKTFGTGYYHPERMSVISTLENSGILYKKLDDVVNFMRETIISENNPQNYIGLAGVEADTGELSGINENATGQAFLYKENDVLYGRLRPYLNKVLLAEKNGICSTEFHVMRVKHTKELLPEYLATVMRSKLIVSQTKHMMTGNTHPRISNDDVKNLYIPIPDITIQQKITTEVLATQKKARQLKIKAEHDWQAAIEQFEKNLLGE
ncbi:MAG: restriction endonuclease subunit S [Oscillospiraceae bacterium]